jgi:DNA-binding protein H-NS
MLKIVKIHFFLHQLFKPKNMTTLQELIAQKITLENQIEELRKSELADAVGKIKAMIAEFGLSQ